MNNFNFSTNPVIAAEQRKLHEAWSVAIRTACDLVSDAKPIPRTLYAEIALLEAQASALVSIDIAFEQRKEKK